MSASSPNSYTEAPVPNVMVFGGGTFERQLRLDEVKKVRAHHGTGDKETGKDQIDIVISHNIRDGHRGE